MKKIYNNNHYFRIIKSIIFILLVTIWSCDKMDKTYAEFLESGQIIYNGKLDSVKTFPGKNRILVTWRPINDPRVTNVKVFWANKRESIEKAITSKNDTTLLIENLNEGNYTFNFTTYDDTGNNSVPVEVVGMAYGELYERGLVPRQIRDISMNDNELTINFRSTDQLDNYHNQEITYISSSGQVEKTISVPKDVSTIVISDYSGDMFAHKSVYLPSELSPDFFYTSSMTQYTPVNPLLAHPKEGETEISCAPEFQWHNSALLPDGKYVLEYSTDQILWSSIVVTGNESHIPKTILSPNTLYYWRITATKGAETRESEIQRFTTGEKTLYGDGEVVRMQSHTTGLYPVRIAFTGDGFQQGDYNYNGPFDRYVEEAIEAFFSVEPYKSYREYFEVWKVAAYSEDGNISESDRSIRLNTAFQSNYNGNTITCSAEKVYQYVKNIPEVDDADLSKITTIVVLNKKRQGGASHVSDDLRSIALVPLYRNSRIGVYTDFTDEIIRQGGGFSFGLLADESGTANGSLSPSEENELRAAWDKGRFLNIDLTNNPELVRWAHFIGRSGYVRPGIYDGAYGFRSGIYRSEETSSMVNGLNYFNAISREIIVKRILQIAGEPYNFEKFLEKDIARTPYQ
jgi:hypothetical protein